MGGTFDPIHLGHLVTAEEALVQFNLDSVVFMPTGRPVLKDDRAVTSPEHRYLMCVVATAANPDFDVSRLEIDRPGLTYTVDTLRVLKGTYGPSAEIFFITGADAVWEIVTWKEAESFRDLATFIAATRPGYDLASAREQHAEELARIRLEFIEVPALAISSTGIRQRVAERRPIRYLVTESVASYIRKYELYQEAR